MTRGKQPCRVALEGPPQFRPMTTLIPEASRRPIAGGEERASTGGDKPVPMWLRELRRDTREQVL